MNPQTTTTAPVRSTWAVLGNGEVTWRQATEGWTVLSVLGLFATLAAVSFKAARALRSSR